MNWKAHILTSLSLKKTRHRESVVPKTSNKLISFSPKMMVWRESSENLLPACWLVSTPTNSPLGRHYSRKIQSQKEKAWSKLEKHAFLRSGNIKAEFWRAWKGASTFAIPWRNSEEWRRQSKSVDGVKRNNRSVCALILWAVSVPIWLVSPISFWTKTRNFSPN